MLLKDERGTSVALDVLGYQFPDAPSEDGFDWDANWLVILGVVNFEERSWSFTDPCLTTREAAELGDWLRRVALGEVPPSKDAGIGGRGAGFFVEPNIAVTLVAVTDNAISLVWSFSQESAPPGALDEERFGDGFPVPVTVSPQALLGAVDVWAETLTRFPQRRRSPER